ncbi:MAG: acyl-phosphate glycerol 3-phosphate acyltransferase [Aquificota bacterium]|nr:MAG: acyl-phosphate glycerol 3-phosphate acyltransferase [Aquificota bacterium]
MAHYLTVGKVALLVFVAFFLGSVPFGLLFARLFGKQDPREVGSGNVGATNVARAAGKLAGALTLVLDTAKGYLPVILAWGWLKSPDYVALVGLFAILGHCYSPFLGFKGGKGVATGLGVYLALSPLAVLIAAVVFGLIIWRFRYVSLASLSAAWVMVPLIYLVQKSPLLTLFTAIIALLITWRHRANIQRLLRGEEPRFF